MAPPVCHVVVAAANGVFGLLRPVAAVHARRFQSLPHNWTLCTILERWIRFDTFPINANEAEARRIASGRTAIAPGRSIFPAEEQRGSNLYP